MFGDLGHRVSGAVGEEGERPRLLDRAALEGEHVGTGLWCAAAQASWGVEYRRIRLGRTEPRSCAAMGSLTESPACLKASETTLDVALVIPLHGSAGMFGPSCELCAQLAAEEMNADGGVLGRELRLVPVDGSAPPLRVAGEVVRLIDAGAIDAVVGWHISAVRQAIAPRVAGRVPYVYTALYEGGERTPGVFLAGETPSRQLLPAMRWFAREHAVRRWCVLQYFQMKASLSSSSGSLPPVPPARLRAL